MYGMEPCSGKKKKFKAKEREKRDLLKERKRKTPLHERLEAVRGRGRQRKGEEREGRGKKVV